MKLTDYVNIKQGTDSTHRYSNGNTLPLVQHPFGFASFAPQTASYRGAWFYHPSDRSLEGIRLTRQPSPWISEQGAICILAQRGEPAVKADMRWSGFRPEETVLKPHYMKYRLLRPRATLELAPTNSGACIRTSFDDENGENYISVLPVGTPCFFETCGNTVKGYVECVSDQKKRENAKVYFVLAFRDGDVSEVVSDNESVKGREKSWYGRNAACHVRLAKKCVEFKISTSLISADQALVNLEREHTYSDFDSLCKDNERLWEEHLSRISISSSDEDILRTFYSCLYRAYLYPHRAYEYDENGEAVHYSPGKDTVCKGYRYTDNGFWDTYRTVYSMLPLIAEDEYKKMIEGFITDYKNDGWLPCWTATEPKKCMPSTMIDAVLADAAQRGALCGESLELALEAMIKHANVKSEYPQYGRDGCEEYVKLGYVPNSYIESVNLTLDASYGDWCIARIAKILGKEDIVKEYSARAKNYKNIFDKETGFMRSRDADGNWRDDFTPESWGRDYTEASAWQTSFAVQHDLEGLAALHGGTEKFLKKLDDFFAQPPIYDVGGYHTEIHEMTEMASRDWGQCAISNQPSFHIPFIYAYFGKKDKTEYWVNRICKEGFSSGDDGYPGDEDNGTTACWYLFSAMGFYPITPGNAKYIRFKGIVDGVKICGKTIAEILEDKV
ncbi:MAG: glycoside hydrolase family 92 protein [Ruminococcaceae bacterium]|nr:glycoside hydrolase family 92 protein [Oscillospiraceae bacterium]